jgi:hypothetical protein
MVARIPLAVTVRIPRHGRLAKQFQEECRALAQNTFQNFLKSHEWDYHVSQYFVDHAVTDQQLSDEKSWEELRDYIMQCNPMPHSRHSKLPNMHGTAM